MKIIVSNKYGESYGGWYVRIKVKRFIFNSTTYEYKKDAVRAARRLACILEGVEVEVHD